MCLCERVIQKEHTLVTILEKIAILQKKIIHLTAQEPNNMANVVPSCDRQFITLRILLNLIHDKP